MGVVVMLPSWWPASVLALEDCGDLVRTTLEMGLTIKEFRAGVMSPQQVA